MEKNTRHTPGPWAVDATSILAAEPRGNTIHYPVAYLNLDSRGLAPGEGEANAQLIAAAPDLLEVCEAAVEALKNEWLYQTGQFSRSENPPRNFPPQGSVHGSLLDTMGKLHDAIARATEGGGHV